MNCCLLPALLPSALVCKALLSFCTPGSTSQSSGKPHLWHSSRRAAPANPAPGCHCSARDAGWALRQQQTRAHVTAASSHLSAAAQQNLHLPRALLLHRGQNSTLDQIRWINANSHNLQVGLGNAITGSAGPI